jgi:hypothetical protein
MESGLQFIINFADFFIYDLIQLRSEKKGASSSVKLCNLNICKSQLRRNNPETAEFCATNRLSLPISFN